jgi:hypothetical protein
MYNAIMTRLAVSQQLQSAERTLSAYRCPGNAPVNSDAVDR